MAVQLGRDTHEDSSRAGGTASASDVLLVGVGVGLLYYLAARIGLELRDPDAPAALLWPAAGVGFAALALVLHGGRRSVVAAVAVGLGGASFLANHLDGKDVALSAGFTAANLTESGVGAYVFWRLRRGRERPMTFVLALVAAVFVGSAAGALVAEIVVAPQLGARTGSLSRYWFVPDAGIWVVAPAFLLGHRRFAGLWGPVGGVALPAGRRVEAIGQVALLAALVVIAFGRAEPLSLAYLPIPAVVWAAARLGPRWTTLSVLGVAVAAVVFTRADRGPFVIGADPDVNLVVAQVFLVVASATGLVLVALVAERNQAVDRSVAAEQLYRSVFAAKREGIVVFGDDGALLASNAAAERLLGLDAAQLRGDVPVPAGWRVRPASDDVDREVARSVAALVRLLTGRCAAGPITVEGDEDGARHLATVTDVLSDETDGRPWASVTTLVDVTRAQEMERAKREFVSVVSHELRTPLTSIRGALGLLASGKMGDFETAPMKMIGIASTNAERLVRLVDDILDVQRIETKQVALDLAPLDLGPVVAQAVDEMSAAATQAGVELRIGSCEGTVLADRDRLVQTLVNLVSNAVKFSPAGSAVDLTSSVLDDDVVVAVTDRGRGIPDDRQEEVFGWFEQIDASDAREKGGSGLGLAICKAIVEGHGGRIWVESRVGIGSTFSFSVPRGDVPAVTGPASDRPAVTVGSRERAPARPHRSGTVPADAAGGRLDRGSRPASVLIVEDDEDLAGVLAQMLEDRRTRVRRVLDLEGALREIGDFDPDVVLLDLNLPDGEGSTIVDAIADGTLRTDATVIVHTARDVVGLERTVLRLGGAEIYRKGRLAPDDLATRIARAAHGQARTRALAAAEDGHDTVAPSEAGP